MQFNKTTNLSQSRSGEINKPIIGERHHDSAANETYVTQAPSFDTNHLLLFASALQSQKDIPQLEISKFDDDPSE